MPLQSISNIDDYGEFQISATVFTGDILAIRISEELQNPFSEVLASLSLLGTILRLEFYGFLGFEYCTNLRKHRCFIVQLLFLGIKTSVIFKEHQWYTNRIQEG